MKIGNKKVESIIISTKDNEVLCVISDNEIIEHKDYKVILESAQN